MGDFGNFLLDIMDVITSLFDAIGNTEDYVLVAFENQIPNAINTILDNQVFETLYGVMIPVGMVIGIVYLCLDIMDKVSMDEVSLPTIALSFVKVIVILAVINNGIIIFKGFNGMSMWVVDIIKNELGAPSAAINAVNGDVNMEEIGKGVFGIIVFVITMLMPHTFILFIAKMAEVLFLSLAIPIIAYQRALKIGFNCLMMPLVASDTAGHGISTSKTVHFLLELLKLFMEFPIIYMALLAFFSLPISFESFDALVYISCLTAILFKGGSYVKSIFN